MTEADRSTGRRNAPDEGDREAPERRAFERPTITKLGKLTRVVKDSGFLTIGGEVG